MTIIKHDKVKASYDGALEVLNTCAVDEETGMVISSYYSGDAIMKAINTCKMFLKSRIARSKNYG